MLSLLQLLLNQLSCRASSTACPTADLNEVERRAEGGLSLPRRGGRREQLPGIRRHQAACAAQRLGTAHRALHQHRGGTIRASEPPAAALTGAQRPVHAVQHLSAAPPSHPVRDDDGDVGSWLVGFWLTKTHADVTAQGTRSASAVSHGMLRSTGTLAPVTRRSRLLDSAGKDALRT